MKTKRKTSSLKISPFFCPKLDEDQKKRSSLKFSPIFGPKLGGDQKKKKKKGSSLRFYPLVCSNFPPKLQRVLKLSAVSVKFCIPCRNFAYYFMLITLSWRHKRWAMAPWPPLNTPLSGCNTGLHFLKLSWLSTWLSTAIYSYLLLLYGFRFVVIKFFIARVEN